MSYAKDGGPAFPLVVPGNCDAAYDGMTLRDYFAATAIAGTAQRDYAPSGSAYPVVAKAAYAIADAMLKERLK